MREVAPDASITYSRTASAPTSGYDVGVVVVGETPNAEGVATSATAAPTCRCLPPAGPRSTACAARWSASCSSSPGGRCWSPTGWRGSTRWSSWLPGSEGGGVADVLFGAKPFTGRAPGTWNSARGGFTAGRAVA
jgi:beta-glucosidase